MSETNSQGFRTEAIPNSTNIATRLEPSSLNASLDDLLIPP